MLLANPFTGKLVDVSDDEVVDQLLRAGFKKQEPEAVGPDEGSAPVRRTRKPRK